MQANFNLLTEIRGHRRMSDFLVETILKAGATHVFAMPAESLNPVLDAVRKQQQVRIITVRHEGNGALMASAYAKLTGRLGVCMGTAGPGASHLPIGTYDAKADGAPLLAISGQVPIHQVGSGGFQEIDPLALFQDSVSFSRLIASVGQTALLPLACAHALHRRTAVHLAFPSDVLSSRVDPRAVTRLHPEWLVPRPVLDEGVLRRAAARLAGKGGEAVVLVGALDAEVRQAVEAIATRLNAPILVLPEGIHYLPEKARHPTLRLTGQPGESGRELAEAADRILAIGPMSASLAELLSSSARVVQVAPAREVARPTYGAILRLAGDVPELLLALGQHVACSNEGKLLRRAEILADADRNASGPLGRDLWTALDQALPQNAVLALEPGPILASAFRYLSVRQRTVTSSFHHGARGYAFPAALAATLVYPDRPAFAIASKEGLCQAMAEFLSAQKYSLPVKTICLAGIRNGEDLPEDIPIDFAAFAVASGIEVFRAKDMATLTKSVEDSGRLPVPSIVCVAAEVTAPLRLPQPYELKAIGDSDSAKPAAAVGAQPYRPTFGSFLIECLVRAGVTRVYGRPRPALESFIRGLEKDGRIGFVPVLHPESASLMASAHSKWTARPGVCVAADAPDLLLQLNGIYDASFDRTPLIILTGRGPDRQRSWVGFSPLDPERLLSDMVASSVQLRPDEEAIPLVAQALQGAHRSRTVTHLSLDWNAMTLPGPTVPVWFDPLVAPEPLLPAPELLREAARRLSGARRPAILVGRGALGSREEIEEIASLLRAPIIATMPGRGVVPDEHPHMVGGIGASGHRAAIKTLERCDTLLVLGSSNRGAIFGLVGRFFLVQVDRDPLQLGRRSQATLGLYGSTKETLQELLQHLRCHPLPGDRLPERMRQRLAAPTLQKQRERFLWSRRRSFERWLRAADRLRHSRRRPIRPPMICHALRKVLGDLGLRAILTVDVGVTTLWVYRHLVGNHDLIWTSSFATMGFSLPAAIAIGELEPSRRVIAMTGDGGIGITMAELATAVRLRIPILVVVFNNGKLAAIKYEQEVMGWPEFESSLFNCDFTQYARACGAHGIRVTEPETLEQALQEGLSCGKPCVVDVLCDPHDLPAPPKIHPLQGAGYLLALSRELGLHVRQLFGVRAR